MASRRRDTILWCERNREYAKEQVLYSKKPGFRDIMSLKHADDFEISDLKTSFRRTPNEAQTQPDPTQRQVDLLTFGTT